MSNNIVPEQPTALRIIREFQNYVVAQPTNKHNRFVSFQILNSRGGKLLNVFEGLKWGEVESTQTQLNSRLKYEFSNRPLADRTLELFWTGVAYCYEYAVVQNTITYNPFKHYLPKNPRSGSYLD